MLPAMESEAKTGSPWWPGNNRLSKIECILGTGTSQNASRDRRLTCFQPAVTSEASFRMIFLQLFNWKCGFRHLWQAKSI